jgi:hypothetical protein
MAHNEIYDVARLVDEAHAKKSQHIEKTQTKKTSKTFLFTVITVAFVIVAPVLGYFSVQYLFPESEEVTPEITTPEVQPVPEEVTEKTVETEIPSDALSLSQAILSDPQFFPKWNLYENAVNSYNLALELQKPKPETPLALNKIRGATDAYTTLVLTSVGFAEAEGALLSSKTGSSSISLGTGIAEPLKDPATLEAKLQLLSRLSTALTIDPYAVLENAPNKEKAYETYASELSGLLSISEGVQNDITAETKILETSVQSLTNEQESLQNRITDARQTLDPAVSLEGLLSENTRVSGELSSASTRLVTLKEVSTKLTAGITQLKARIEAVQKNREALIRGIRITPVEGSNVTFSTSSN